MCLVDPSSNEWPHGDIQPYLPEFTDGWQPPQLSPTPEPKGALSRVETPPPAPTKVRALAHIWVRRRGAHFYSVFYFFFSMQTSARWKPPPPPQGSPG